MRFCCLRLVCTEERGPAKVSPGGKARSVPNQSTCAVLSSAVNWQCKFARFRLPFAGVSFLKSLPPLLFGIQYRDEYLRIGRRVVPALCSIRLIFMRTEPHRTVREKRTLKKALKKSLPYPLTTTLPVPSPHVFFWKNSGGTKVYL